MSNGIRSLAAGLTKTVAKFIGNSNRQISLPIEISLKVESRSGGVTKAAEPLTVNGQTSEMGYAELSFIVPFVRIGENYLAGHGEQKHLKVFFELPNGKVRMTVAPVRYEMINLHDSVQQYVISAQIVQVNEGDLARYKDFVKLGDKVSLVKQSSIEPTSTEKKGAISILSN